MLAVSALGGVLKSLLADAARQGRAGAIGAGETLARVAALRAGRDAGVDHLQGL